MPRTPNPAAPILLLDEVLAVGDIAFSQKCIKRILEFRAAGGTVVLVTHETDEAKIHRSMDRIASLDFIAAAPSFIRIENL